MRDVESNCIAKVTFSEPASQLSIYSELNIQHFDSNPFDFILEDSVVYYPFVYDPYTLPELSAFTPVMYPKDSARLGEWLLQFWKPGQTPIQTLTLLQNLNQRIHDTFQYQRRDEPGVQTPAETLQKNGGSCRDFATLFLEACHHWGLAARFASGYMLCEATEAGGASTHAWTEVYLPGAGWKGFDPTSGIVTGAQHVTVAVARDPESAAPVAGSFVGPTSAFQGMTVEVKVFQTDKSAPPPPAPNPQPQNLPTNQQLQQVQQAQQAPTPMEMVIQS
jgi:transglutaminase-like putative cysteine protease